MKFNLKFNLKLQNDLKSEASDYISGVATSQRDSLTFQLVKQPPIKSYLKVS